jgi:hypothetical protein
MAVFTVTVVCEFKTYEVKDYISPDGTWTVHVSRPSGLHGMLLDLVYPDSVENAVNISFTKGHGRNSTLRVLHSGAPFDGEIDQLLPLWSPDSQRLVILCHNVPRATYDWYGYAFSSTGVSELPAGNWMRTVILSSRLKAERKQALNQELSLLSTADPNSLKVSADRENYSNP